MIQALLLGAALAADACAVTAALAVATGSRSLIVRAAVLFGLFQAGMAGLGALAGAWLSAWLGPWTGWVAFVVLAALGVRMMAADDEQEVPAQVSFRVLLSLAVATSIDALAAGVSLPLLEVPVLLALLIIGLTTLVMAGAAGVLGRMLGERFGRLAQRLGGVTLILVGVGALAG